MRINSYTKEDVVVLEPSGKLMAGQDVGELDEKLYALLGKGQKQVILDFRKTDWIASSGISILIHHYGKFKEIGGNLKLANLTKKVQQIIVITKLTLVFEVYDTLEAAVDSFKK
jgi:anti-sigma B factor antagonist